GARPEVAHVAAVQRLGGGLLGRGGVQQARVVDQDAQRWAAQPGLQAGEQGAYVAVDTELAADEKRLPAGLLDGGHGLLGGRVVAGVVHRDQSAVGAQPLGNGPADAPRGAGHQRRLTGQIPHVDLLVWSSGWFDGLVWLRRGLDRNLSSGAVPITRFRRSALAGIDDPAERVERNVGGGNSGPLPRGPQVTQTLEPGNDRLEWRPSGGQV